MDEYWVSLQNKIAQNFLSVWSFFTFLGSIIGNYIRIEPNSKWKLRHWYFNFDIDCYYRNQLWNLVFNHVVK